MLKLYSEVEAKCLDWLMRDPLKPFVPQYHGLVNKGEHCYIRLEDLLRGLRRPVIMDCKMGVRYVCMYVTVEPLVNIRVTHIVLLDYTV